ncbi:hypothetical protein AGMMS49975_20180 [Clostridia bacterium]|nr:hypothetical protein AGMMS49975_20180 [Clostridia bacterium]
MPDNNGALGFTYNGEHSSAYGIVTRSLDLPFVAESKTAILDVPDRDGSYVFTNPSGDVHYKESTIQLECKILARNITSLNQKLAIIADWLARNPQGRLTLESVPDVYWEARLFTGLHFTPLYNGISATFVISFAVFPFSFGMELETQTIQPGGTYSGINKGRPTPLKITATGGSLVKVSLAQSGTQTQETLYNNIYDSITIDADTATAVDNAGNNLIRYLTGEFIIVPNGAYTITNLSTTAVTCSWRERWFYGKIE